MKFDGFFDESERFIAGFIHGNAPGQGHLRPNARGTLFHDDQVSHSYRSHATLCPDGVFSEELA